MKRSAWTMLTLLGALLTASMNLSGAPAQEGTSETEDPRAKFAGTWRLISFETRRADGQFTDRGYIGRIVYDRHGNMAAQLMRKTRDGFTTEEGRPRPTDEEYRNAYRSYTAYFGKYTIDAEKGTVTHHVEGSLNPAWPGRDLVRYWEFKEGRLALSLRREGETTGVLTWDRME